MPRSRRTAPASPKPPDRYHHGDLRRALIDTAVALIEEQGVDALTLRELARRLGVSHAAPAHHFPDRAALLVAVAVEGHERLAEALERAVADLPPGVERLRAFGRAYVRFALDHPSHLQVMFGREVGGLVVRPVALQRAADRAGKLLEGAIEGMVRIPARRPDGARDPFVEARTFTLWAMVHGVARLWIDGPMRASMRRRGGDRARFEELAGFALDFAMEALAGSLAGTRPPAGPGR